MLKTNEKELNDERLRAKLLEAQVEEIKQENDQLKGSLSEKEVN